MRRAFSVPKAVSRTWVPGRGHGQTHGARRDRQIHVREQSTERKIWWGQYNRPVTSENFSALLARLQGYLQGRDVFVQDCFAGADPEYSLPIRIITQKAWHSSFARTMFLKIRVRTTTAARA